MVTNSESLFPFKVSYTKEESLKISEKLLHRGIIVLKFLAVQTTFKDLHIFLYALFMLIM